MSEDILEALTGIVAVATLPVGVLTGVFVGGEAAAVVFVVGWLLLVPVLGILEDRVELGAEATESNDPGGAAEDDPLQRLRERYATGEIDEAEFERRLERLLETENVDLPEGARDPPGRDRGRDPERRERERE